MIAFHSENFLIWNFNMKSIVILFEVIKRVHIFIEAPSWENLLLPYANNKGADQHACPCSLISTFVVHYLDSIIPLVSISKISSLYLASVVANPEGRFFHEVAHW